MSTDGRFALLLGDLLSVVCTHLNTELLTLRLVSKHWSAASRAAPSWAASSWCYPDTWLKGRPLQLDEVVAAAPHLRSLQLPPLSAATPDELVEYVSQLKSLEELRIYFCFPETRLRFQQATADLLALLPNLRRIEVGEQTSPMEDLRQVAIPPLEALRIKEGFVSLQGVASSVDTALGELSQSVSAETTLIALRISVGCSWASVAMSRFLVLEELNLAIKPFTIEVTTEPFVSSIRLLGSMPALRILTLDSWLRNTPISDEHVEALLSSPSFAARLESLDFVRCSFGRASVQRIMGECTSLVSFGIHRHANAAYEPIEEVEWITLQADVAAAAAAAAAALRKPFAIPPAATIHGAPHANSNAPTSESWFAPDELDLTLFLLAPPAFRRRLLHLTLSDDCMDDMALAQLVRRFPSLCAAEIGAVGQNPSCTAIGDKGVEGLSQAADEEFAWMELDVAVSSPHWPYSASPFVPSFPTLARPIATPAVPPPCINLLEHPSESHFRLVRALKRHAGLKLTAAETSPTSRWI